MGSLEAVERDLMEVKADIVAVEGKITEAEGKIEDAEAAGNRIHVQRWVKKEEQLREEKIKLREKENKLLDEKARLQSASLGSTLVGEPNGGAQLQGDQAGVAVPAIQLQLPEDLAAFLRRAVKKEINIEFPDEISVGGSKMDLTEAMEALVRMGFEGLETVLGKTDGAAYAESSAVFQWKSGVREDDSSNMTRAQSFVQESLSNYIEGFKVVNICQRNIFSKVDATPTKRLKLRDTRTDLALVTTEFEEQARENPRNVLHQTSGIVDTKTQEAWKKSHEEFRGQALGQFAGCTLISHRKGVGMPVMLTNLVGDSHVFHGVQRPDGSAMVREVVFTNQAAAFQYFGKVCKKAEIAPRRNLADLLAELDDVPHVPAAQLESPSMNPLLRTAVDNVPPSSPGLADNDLTECIYKEVQREHPLFNLPPFELMMQYWGNLEQGLLKAAEVRSSPSYIC